MKPITKEQAEHLQRDSGPPVFVLGSYDGGQWYLTITDESLEHSHYGPFESLAAAIATLSLCRPEFK